ncbi:TlpA disulfide reductase family protein [Thauera sp. WH-1]|uniref:TlpA disulfide reductase family protein n=1 Tax=Thauera sp. WH-1 TaxID=3398230 RepID=UPI0039FC30E9
MSRSFRYVVRTLFAIAIAFPGVVHAWKPEIDEIPGEIETFEYLDGTPLSVEALRGKPVLLYFGADWCPPCHRARPEVLRVARAFRDEGLEVVFLSFDDNAERDLKRGFEASMGVRVAMPRLDSCPPKHCSTRTTFQLGAFGRLFGLPLAVVIDAQGVVRAKLDRGQRILRELAPEVAAVMPAAR